MTLLVRTTFCTFLLAAVAAALELRLAVAPEGAKLIVDCVLGAAAAFNFAGAFFAAADDLLEKEN